MQKKIFALIFISFLFFSCQTTKKSPKLNDIPEEDPNFKLQEEELPKPDPNFQISKEEFPPKNPKSFVPQRITLPPPPLRLVFAGDVMAHEPNFRMSDYSLIWDDIRYDILSADFSFANIEAPVVANLPFSGYPSFNMQPSYPQAAFDAGFNLISLANNHTDDKNASGIHATKLWAEEIARRTRYSPRPIYFSGLTDGKEFSFSEFYWKGKKILFIAMTEIVNTWKDFSEINFVEPNAKGRAAFVSRIKKMKEEYDPDLFLVSIHTGEEEYVRTIQPSVKKFYHDLVKAGADIVVANHPHVIRPVEFFIDPRTNKIRKVIMYANGNTISTQRRSLNYKNPNDEWEATGDGQFVTLMLEHDDEGFFVIHNRIQFITTFFPNGSKSPVIRKLDENFIESLEEEGNTKDAEYYRIRLNSVRNIEEIYSYVD